jgi:hypothetical protein
VKLDTATYRLTDAGKAGPISLIVGVIGLVACAGAWYADSARFYHAWLTAFLFWLSMGLAGLFFTMLHYLTAARWSVVLRRISEALMMQLPWMIVAFIPVFLGMHDLFHWTHEEAVAQDHLLQWKSGYLNVSFFTVRAVVFFAVWTILALVLRKRSLAQDTKPKVDHVAGLRKVSAGGMLLFALTVTFASFDWLMSLEPHWFSTIFGVYFFGGLFLGGVSLMAIICWILRRGGVLRDSITVEHYHDLGKLMFAFTIFWAYIGFSQYFLIWYGNIPEETFWFLARWEGGWKTISLILVFGHFAIPFVILIFQQVKRRIALLGTVAIWYLIMHWLDQFWLVYPPSHKTNPGIGWIEIVPVLGLGGIFLWSFWRNFAAAPTVPVGDPWLEPSKKFVNH